jgi:hypothetical protein
MVWDPGEEGGIQSIHLSVGCGMHGTHCVQGRDSRSCDQVLVRDGVCRSYYPTAECDM